MAIVKRKSRPFKRGATVFAHLGGATKGDAEMTTKTLASSLAALAMFAAQGAVEPVWESSLKGTTINAVGFENFTVGTTIGANAADDGTSDATKAYFLYSGNSGDDQSVVTNHPSGTTFTDVPTYFGTFDNNNYLSLSTEGGTLFRSLNVVNGTDLGTAETIPDSGLFVDTLVQFTPCEEPPAFNENDGNKLAVWLSVSNGENEVSFTNVCVRAGYWDYAEGVLSKVAGGATYTLANTSEIDVQPGEWVRLTVKAINNVYSSTTIGEMPAFQVYINDTLAVFTEDVASAAALAQIGTLEAAAQTALATKTILPSMQDAAARQAVGFQGTGAVDDFVVTTEKPGFLAVDFTLYWDTNILALEAYINFEDQETPTPETITIADLNKVFGSATAGQTLDIMIPGAGLTEVASGYDIDWANTVMTNATAEPLLADETDETSLYGYRFTLTGDGPYSVTLVTKSTLPPFDGGTGAENDPYIISSARALNNLVALVAGGETYANTFFALGGNIDFETAGLNPFPGIGTYNKAIASGVPFSGTFDGAGYKFTNVDFTQRNYAGIFNQVNGGTIKNLTVSNITCSAFSADVNDGEFALSIIGHAGNGATIQNVVSEGSIASAEQPCTHNIAGIVIRLSANALVKDCTNNAALYGCYTKLGGICALTQTGSTPVRFEGCVNNGTITALQNADAAKPGRDGVAGIVAYVDLPTVLKDCSNTGAMSSVLSTAAIGELVGKHNANQLTDEGNNTGVAANKFVGIPHATLTGIKYATVENNVATTTTNLVKDTTYLLESNVAASETPVFTLEVAADTISFDASLGFTFAGTIATSVADSYVASATSGNVTTYSVAAKTDVSDAAIALDSASATWSDQLAFPAVTVTAGGNTLAAADYTVAWTTGGVAVAEIAAMEAGDDDIVYTATVTLNYSADQYILPASAPTATFTVSAPGGGDLTPVNPDGAVVAVQAATAEAALAKVELRITDTAAAAAGQASVVKLVAAETSEGSGTWNVSVAIDEDAEAFVDPDEAVAVVAGVLSGSNASVTVPAAKLTPGLYYSLAVSTDVDGTYTEGTRYLAAGEAISLPVTKPEGTKAFYKVLVNMTSGQE